ncbi:MAG TPA: hypothetical protein VF868_15235 [Bacteroidia bacterium]|jgi:hypothetical protein
MNFKSKINEIKKIVIGLSDETQLADDAEAKAKLIDGTEIKYEKLAEGEIVMIVSADGSESPLPAGQYDLDNGYVLVIGDDKGTIQSYDVKPEETEVPEAEAEAELADEETPDVAKQISDLEARVAKLEEAMKESINLSASLAEKNAELSTSTVALSQQLANATDAKPIRRTPEDEVIAFEQMTPLQKHRYLKNKEKK